MTEDAGEIVQRCVDALNRRDFHAAMQELHPDVVWQPFLNVGEQAIHGRASVRRRWEDIAESTAEWRIRARDIRSRGDDVYYEFDYEITGRASGVNMTSVLYAHMRLRDGLVAGFQWFETSAEALAAAGLA